MASPITAKAFVEAYLNVHQSNGTITELADALNRSEDQVRAKKNSLSAQLKARGVSLPPLKRKERDGSAYDEATNMVAAYMQQIATESVDTDTDS
jgi:hypothetical protein|tara:strand:- start:4831 stop:5115 length:285 start_codon:yes stop_codon:yes gene_type:complete